MGQGESQAVTSAHRASPQQGGKGAVGEPQVLVTVPGGLQGLALPLWVLTMPG